MAPVDELDGAPSSTDNGISPCLTFHLQQEMAHHGGIVTESDSVLECGNLKRKKALALSTELMHVWWFDSAATSCSKRVYVPKNQSVEDRKSTSSKTTVQVHKALDAQLP